MRPGSSCARTAPASTGVSNIVSVTNGGEKMAGGLLRRSVAVVGNTILTAYLLTFHTTTRSGSAAFSCTM
jgi:hypothetical protein